MSTLLEIEEAARRLPPAEQAILIRHLQRDLPSPRSLHKERRANRPPPTVVEWPDFNARLRAIYGDKVMPNMVLEERESSDR